MAVICRNISIGTYVGATGAIARIEAVDVTCEVAKGEVTKLDAGVVWSFGAADAALVDICLTAVNTCDR